MNGWQRMWTLIAALLIVPALAMWWTSRPEQGAAHYAVGCVDSHQYTPEEARRELERNQFIQSEYSAYSCKDELTDIATGRVDQQAMESWRSMFRVGAMAIGIFLAALYCIGWGIGWVYRGFRPKRSG